MTTVMKLPTDDRGYVLPLLSSGFPDGPPVPPSTDQYDSFINVLIAHPPDGLYLQQFDILSSEVGGIPANPAAELVLAEVDDAFVMAPVQAFDITAGVPQGFTTYIANYRLRQDRTYFFAFKCQGVGWSGVANFFLAVEFGALPVPVP